MPDMVGFKYGEFSALPEGTTNGTIYVAKAADGKAYMYVDKDGEKLNITSPNATFYGEAEWEDEETINVDLEGFSLELGSQVTIKMPSPYDEDDFGTSPILNQTYLTVNNMHKAKMVTRQEARRTLLTGSIWTFVYTNTGWELVGEVDTVNNGITLSPSSTFINNGRWSDSDAPLLVGNITISDFASLTGTPTKEGAIKSVKAFYKPGITPTLGEDGTLTIPGGYLAIGEYDSHQMNYITIASDNMYDYSGQPGCIRITPNYIHWHDFNGVNDCILYFNETGIALAADMIYGGRFANITSDEVWFGPSVTTNSNFYSAGRRHPHVYYGTTTPSPSTGQNGDVYIMYN